MKSQVVTLSLAAVAFLVAAVLVIMIFRMLFGGRLRMPGGRARQARLGIVDAFDLDRQRQLIIVRRDNVEHLIMIGGPNDVVVEAEIIRAEARDMRREPALAQGFSGDAGRIPAPMPSLERAPPGLPAGEQYAAEEPPLPLPMPAAAEAAPEPSVASRGPTFPLPPRRPTQPERRPAPPPPKLPDSVSRGDEVPSLSGQPPAPAPAPPRPMPPPAARPASPPQPAPPAAAPPIAPAGPAAAQPAGPAAAPPPRPPFLKPPPARPPGPPVRPLPRTTPQPGVTPPSPSGQAASPPNGPGGQIMPPQSGPAAPRPPAGIRPPGGAPPPRPGQPAPAAPSPPKGDPAPDALESLEEEMAKLLGRGS